MSSTVSSAAWVQAALARSVHTAAASTTGGRHRAPETTDAVEYLTSEQIAAGPGRHAEPEWTRESFDPARDVGDSFAWSLAVNGNSLLVGSPFQSIDPNNPLQEGVAYLFQPR